MFIPKKYKYKKQQKGKSFLKINTKKSNNTSTNFKLIVLKTREAGLISSNQLKSFVFATNKKIKKIGRLIVPIFPHKPVSKKPIETRMGKGKGNVHHWVANIKAGTTVCKIETGLALNAANALKYSKIRLPLKTKIIF